MKICLLMALTMVGAAAQCQSESLTTDLSLESLLNLEVVSATRGSVSFRESPVPISVITAQEIANSGAANLAGVLARLAGVDVLQMGASQTEVSIRGKGVNFNRRLLVLIDGRSEYTDLFGVTLWHAMPITLQDVERIEVVRGPASAVYGANAFAGVVNIITKSATDRSGEVTVAGGTSQRAHGHLRYEQIRNRHSLVITGGGEDVDSLNTRVVFPGFNRTPTSNNFVDDAHSSGIARLTVKSKITLTEGWDLTLRTGITQGDLELFPQPGLPREDWDVRRTYFQAEVNFSTSPIHRFTAQFHYTGFDYQTKLVPTTAEVLSATEPGKSFYPSIDGEHLFDGNSQLGAVSLVWDGRSSTQRLSWVTGLEVRSIDNHGGLVDDSDKQIASGFVNASYEVHSQLIAAAGFRLDEDSITDSDYGYNASAIWLPSNQWECRLTARRAFRAPSLFELFTRIDLNVPRQNHRVRFRGNAGLDVETIETIDFTLFYRFEPRSQFELEFYRESYADLIGNPDSGRLTDIEFDPETNLFTTTTSFENLADARNSGAQLSWRFIAHSGHQWFANVAYMDPQGLNDVAGETFFSPQWKVNAGWDLQHESGFDVHLEGHYIDTTNPNEFKRGDIAADGPNFTRDHQESQTSVTLRLGQTFEFGSGLDCYLIVRNLFDQRYVAYYEYDSVLNAVGEEARREFEGGLRWRF